MTEDQSADRAPIPRNDRHRRFAESILAGMAPIDAYFKAGFKPASRESAGHAARRLMARADVAAYLDFIRRRVALEDAVLSHLEIRRYLARVVRTPIGSIDPDSDATGTLCTQFSESESETGTTRTVRIVDRLKAIELDLRLTGDDPAGAAITELAAAITRIGGPAVPDDRM
jgi:hypothetical protein